MPLDPVTLAARISEETGILLLRRTALTTTGTRRLALFRLAMEQSQTFAIRTTLLWRRLRIDFLLGRFAMPLLEHMAAATADGQSTFRRS